MKVINATWDEKVTGLKTCEVLFEKGDTVESYLNAGLENDFRFIVTKIPVNDLKLVHELESNGFRYLENQMKLSFDVSQLDRIEPSWKRLLNGFRCEPVTSVEGFSVINSEVRDRMFETDRFTLDPFWQSGISSLRYKNWIRELYESEDARFYIIVHNEIRVGFFVVKGESKNVNICPIAGIFNKYKGAGYIFALTWFWLDISRKAGDKKVITSVSSNNRVILSSLSKAFTFRISNTSIVLRKVVL